MLINASKVVEIFCEMDDFCKGYEEKLAAHLLPCSTSVHSVNQPSLWLSELVTVEVRYHRSGHKCFRYYYEQEVLAGSLHSYFPLAPLLYRFEIKSSLSCFAFQNGTQLVAGVSVGQFQYTNGITTALWN